MSNEEIALVVDGKRYAGWTSVRVTRSIESIAGSFALEATDRWDDREAPWPIVEEDPCRVEIDGVAVINGYVDERTLSASASSRTLSYSGRDRAAALVDNSLVDRGWTFAKMNVVDFVSRLAKPFGVHVSVQDGLKLPELDMVLDTVSVAPGVTVFEAIVQATKDLGLLFVSDGAGGIIITRAGIAGTSRATSLVEGENILSASVEYNGTERYRRYILSGQRPELDTTLRHKVETHDLGVRRPETVLLIRSMEIHDAESLQRRANWEAKIRAGRAEAATITVVGWKQSDGSLWAPNTLTRVRAPRLIGLDADMLISQVEYSISDSGRITQLRVVRPDTFAPEPQATAFVTVPVKERCAWKDLCKGALPDATERAASSAAVDRARAQPKPKKKP